MNRIMLFLFLFALNSLSKDKEDDNLFSNINLQSYLNGPSNVGTEFWLTVPPPYLVQDPTNYTRFFIVASTDANVRITQEGGVDSSISIPAGTVKSIDLKPGECQPYIHNYATSQKGAPAQIYNGKALHLTSDQPIIVYVMVRYRYTSDGYLAIPVDGLSKKYVATNYDARELNGSDPTAGNLPNMLCIVGTKDDSKIDFTLGGNLETKVEILGGKRLRPGDKHTWKINKGDVIVISNIDADETLSGSLIESDKDIAVFSGNYCADVPLRVRACDYIVEQDLPIDTWGQLYAIPSFNYRNNSSILRVFAKEAATIVWRDGQELLYFSEGVEMSGEKINNAWAEMRVWPLGLSNKPAIYSSDKPIYISLYNPGSEDDNQPTDPFSMIITSMEQYQNEIIFATPAADGGLNFRANFLNLIVELDENDQIPENVLFGKVKNDGTTEWTKFNEKFGKNVDSLYKIGSGNDKSTFKDSPFIDKRFGHKQISLPGDGVYKIRSNSLLTGFSSGLDNYDSYGFPTAGFYKFNSKDKEKPIISFEIDCNGKVIGNTQENENDLNSVGLISPKFDLDNTNNFNQIGFNGSSFQPGDKKLNWTLSVVDSTKEAKAIVYFSDRSGNVAVDSIEYVPTSIGIPEPEILYNGSLLLCDSESSVTLTILDKGYARFEWSNGETTESIVVNKAGIYNVKVFDENDCFLISESIEVKSVTETELNIGISNANDVICKGEVITLTAIINDKGSILWSNGETTNEIEVSESGEYYYNFTPENVECEFTSEIKKVEFTELPEKPVIVYDNLTLNIETESEKINWYFNDVLAEKFSDMKSITPDIDGEYYCEVFESTNTCSSTSDTYNVNWMSVLDDINEKDISITPNPNNGIFNLKIDSEINGNVTLNIYDINGQSVYKQELLININKFNLEINVPKVSKGIYILNLSNGNKEINKKLIIE